LRELRVWDLRFNVQVIWVLLAIFFTALLGMFFHVSLALMVGGSFFGLVYVILKEKQKSFNPQSQTYREIEKLKKKQLKIENNKHKHIHDQILYISQMWGYTKEQDKIITKFIEERAYSKIYNKLTASLFPQMIMLIDNCNAKEQKGCKRKVSKSLREIIELMKIEIKNKKHIDDEDFDTTLSVYNQLLLELK